MRAERETQTGNAGLQPAAAMTPGRDNDTSVTRGPVMKKAGRLYSYGAAQQAAAW